MPEASRDAVPTHHERTFRSWPPELLKGPGGKLVRVTVCEELDPESGRWEPFVSIRPIATAKE